MGCATSENDRVFHLYRAVMTHASVSAEERASLGIKDTLVVFECLILVICISHHISSHVVQIRLSVGLEEAEDLVEDVRQALKASYEA